MKAALEAFASGQYERSRDILEALHQKFPGDEAVRKNLAVAYVTLGDKESARRVLAG
jgi:Flp pilus assembly protein TadD